MLRGPSSWLTFTKQHVLCMTQGPFGWGKSGHRPTWPGHCRDYGAPVRWRRGDAGIVLIVTLSRRRRFTVDANGTLLSFQYALRHRTVRIFLGRAYTLRVYHFWREKLFTYLKELSWYLTRFSCFRSVFLIWNCNFCVYCILF